MCIRDSFFPRTVATSCRSRPRCEEAKASTSASWFELFSPLASRTESRSTAPLWTFTCCVARPSKTIARLSKFSSISTGSPTCRGHAFLPASSDEDGYLALGLQLVLAVRRKRRHRALPPRRSFVANYLTHHDVEWFGSVLQHDVVGVREQVVVPDRVVRCSTLRGHQSVLTVEFHSHDGRLSHFAGAIPSGRDDHDGKSGVTQDIRARTRGRLVLSDLVT